MSNQPIQLIDCTLREGEQTPGVWWTVEEKLALLDRLAAAGVRWLDAGMPEIGDEERRFLSLATGRTAARIGASIRMRLEALELALDAGCDELFIICPSSAIHRQLRLGLSHPELVARAVRIIKKAAASGRTVNLVAEDSARAAPAELIELLRAAREAGADRIMLCDTVGVLTPGRITSHVLEVRAALGPDVALGVHCHNDFGLATANTLAAIEAGVDWPTVCVNGLGERSGNASLVEVMAACERLLERPTGIRPESLPGLSAEVERVSGIVVSPLQPLVGRNAYRHESGVHVDGLLKGAQTYEPVPPAWMGLERTLVIGKHSGRAHVRHLAEKYGLELTDAALDAVVSRIKGRGPGESRARFATARAALRSWEEEWLGVPENQVVGYIREAGDRPAEQLAGDELARGGAAAGNFVEQRP